MDTDKYNAYRQLGMAAITGHLQKPNVAQEFAELCDSGAELANIGFGKIGLPPLANRENVSRFLISTTLVVAALALNAVSRAKDTDVAKQTQALIDSIRAQPTTVN